MEALRWLSSAYHLGLQADRALSRATRLPRPVLSVGNLSVGGRGKTPFTILLAKWLREQGRHPVVLTRGYGRSIKEPVWLLGDQPEKLAFPHRVLRRGQPALEAEDWGDLAGDEPLEIWAATDADVLVGSDRRGNARAYLRETDNVARSNIVFVLDDGFQHWDLARDFDLVLLDPVDAKDRLLPLGRLREPMSALKRANLALMRGQDFEKHTELRVPPPADVKAGVLTTRAPDSGYIESILESAPNATTVIPLPDHAPYKHIAAAVQGPALPDALIVGAKEAAKILEPEEFLGFLRTGFAVWKHPRREIRLHLATCRLEIRTTDFWPRLETWLREAES
jgi:tetraacyldisaccharide-1-P 4'-kinase